MMSTTRPRRPAIPILVFDSQRIPLSTPDTTESVPIAVMPTTRMMTKRFDGSIHPRCASPAWICRTPPHSQGGGDTEDCADDGDGVDDVADPGFDEPTAHQRLEQPPNGKRATISVGHVGQAQA